MNNNYNRFNERRDYYQKNPQQDRRYPNSPYRSQSTGYNQHYNNSYEPYPQHNYDSYPQRYQSYSQGYDAYQQPPQQQYQYNSNMYNQGPQQPPQQYQYGQPYNNQQYSNIPPANLSQIQNDQEYMNSKLIDFRGRLHEYMPYASPRRAIVRLYMGHQNEDWLINEIIQNMKIFIEYKACVTFLYNIQSKMTYKSHNLIESIVNNYQSILKTPEGYKLFANIAEDVSPEILSNIAQWCFDSFMPYQTSDPDYINLLSVFVEVLYNKPDCYLKMINLSVYLSNPTASVIGCAIVENCSEQVVGNFLNEINSNLSTLLNNKDLSELINSLLIRGQKDIRDLLFNNFYPQLDAFIANPWKWKICSTLLKTLSLDQKVQVAEKVCQNCSVVREKYMDDLIFESLQVVSSHIRVNSLVSLLNPILENPEFPRSQDFLKNLKYADSVIA